MQSPLLMHLLVFCTAAAVIVAAGVFLTRFSDRLAELTGMGRTLAGMLLLAIATSLPELSVDANLAYAGFMDIAIGTLLGSNLMNVMLLACMDLIASRGRMLSSTAAAHSLSAMSSIVLTGIALLLILLKPDGLLPESLHFLPIGIGSICILATYGLSVRLVFFDQRHAANLLGAEPGTREPEAVPYSLTVSVVGYLLAAAAIFITAPFLAGAAEGLAKETGLGETFIGTTLVALSTSLPEAVTTLAAVRMGAFDLAVGNIFGSNAFNMLIIVVVDGFQPGPLFVPQVLSEAHAITAVWSILISSVAMLAILYRPRKRLYVLEPDSWLVIVLVMIALWTVYQYG